MIYFKHVQLKCKIHLYLKQRILKYFSQHLLFIFVINFLLFNIYGGVAFHEHKLPMASIERAGGDSKSSLLLIYDDPGEKYLTTVYHRFGTSPISNGVGRGISAREIFEESCLFSQVSFSDRNTDIVIHLSESRAHIGPPLWAYLPAVLGAGIVLPWKYGDINYYVNAEVTARTKDIVKTYKLQDGISIWTWVPFVATFVTLQHWRLEEKVRKNIFNSLILQMQRDGLID